MKLISRSLEMKLPRGQSAFLWGPRKTGKTSLLKQAFPSSARFDLLHSDLYLDFSLRPQLFRQRVLALPAAQKKLPIVVDEVQKVPALLDEVQGLIEDQGLGFVLCGSSARKLKRGHGNLLGGRAWRFELFPLSSAELGKPDLLRLMNQGAIPSHYLSEPEDARQSLRAYVADYLREEVFAEGLVRNMPAFSRFLEAAGYSHGEQVNYSNVARDCGVDVKTVQGYFQILSDTLLASLVEPFKVRQSRQVITRAPKFYLFDVGVANNLVGRKVESPQGENFGRSLEHLVHMELRAYAAYSGRHFPIRYWRTKAGLEVDFILGQAEVAIEVKAARRLDPREWHGLKVFKDEFKPARALVVTPEARARQVDGVRLLPWQDFCGELWSGKII